MIILIEVGSVLGVLPTVGLVILTAICGVWLLRLEGMATLARVQEKFNRGEIPGTELLEGIMLIIGGALLLTPGFATDFIGFVCLIPGLRRPLAVRIIQSSVFRRVDIGSGFSGYQRHFDQQSAQNFDGDPGRTIDGEFDVQDDANKSLHDHRDQC